MRESLTKCARLDMSVHTQKSHNKQADFRYLKWCITSTSQAVRFFGVHKYVLNLKKKWCRRCLLYQAAWCTIQALGGKGTEGGCIDNSCKYVNVCLLPLSWPKRQMFGLEFWHGGQVEEYLGRSL